MISLTKGAKDLFFKYMKSNPRIKAIEIKEHGVDPVRQPEKFFAAELAEKYHRKIKAQTKAVGGRVTKRILQAWTLENSLQHASK